MELTKIKTKNSFYGRVPNDWITCEFQEVLTGFSSGMTPYRGVPEYYRGNIPWITSGELNYNIITDTYEKITQDAVIKTNLKVLPIGTFLMAITGLEAAGTRGSCGITGVKSTTNQSCMALFPKEGKIDTKYLYHFYVMYGNELAFKFCQGSKQQSYTGRIAKILPINLPPTLTEQKAIATALSDVDDLIANLDKLITKKKAIKQGAMQQLLTPPHKGGKRLAGFTGEWKEVVFTEICNLIHGHQFRTEDFNHSSEGIKVIKIGNVMPDNLITEGCDTIDSNRINEFENFRLKKGDILMSLTGNIGRVVRLKEVKEPLLQNYRVGKFVPKQGVSEAYLSICLGSIKTTRQLEQLSNAAAQANFGKQDFNKVSVAVPNDIKEQESIATIILDISKDIKQLETKKAKYQDIKQGMMQELLTGKTRLV